MTAPTPAPLKNTLAFCGLITVGVLTYYALGVLESVMMAREVERGIER